MPPRGSKEQNGGAAEVHVDTEQKRLQDRAYDQGILSRTRRVCATSLPPTKQMIRADGKDIVKKSSTRRNRYLLIFNCQIAPAAAGKLGTLAQLDSRNPVMYIDFPEGRLKLFGTLTFPHNKYMVLKLGNKEALCEDVLESMIVFSDAWWVGSEDENPEERKLPMPASLQERRHDKYNISSRGEANGKEGGGKEDAINDEDMAEEEEEEEPPSQRPQRAATRTARGKRQRYNEESGEEEDFDDDSEGSEDLAPRKLAKLPGGSQQKLAAQRPKQRQQQLRVGEFRQSNDDEVIFVEEGEASEPRGGQGKQLHQGTLGLFFKKAATETKATPKSGSKLLHKSVPRSAGGRRKTGSQQPDGSQEEPVDLAGGSRGSSDEDEQRELRQSRWSIRPRRTAAGAAAQRLRIESESEKEDIGEGEGFREDGTQEEDVGRDGDASLDDGSQDDEEEEEPPSQEESDYQPSE